MKNHRSYFCLLLILASCAPLGTDVSTTDIPASANDSLSFSDVELGAGYGASSSWMEIYFTDPQSPLASQKTGGVDGPLVQAIDSARLSIDMAAYSLSLNSVRYALINAHERGVRVRVVMESDNLDRSDPQLLIEAGIPVLGDRREGLMHDKFIVIDGSEVWMGSMNFTDSGAYEDNNNLMRIRSVKLAENYTQEFEEMFVDDIFGPDIPRVTTPHPRVTENGIPFDNYFSPDDKPVSSILDLINEAQRSIYFMAFSFTSDALGDAIRVRAQDGLTIRGVMEDEQVKSNQGTEFDAFASDGLDVYRDGNPGQMHHKVMIIDSEIVVAGSYNFTSSAETKNDENFLVIYNSKIAAEFLREFQRVYSQAQK
jgi:phosphatidylserine/phosphatidylglycerophosphate/cardiolipin synthase-like enzyme